MIGVVAGGYFYRPVKWRGVSSELLRRSGTKGERRVVVIDEFTALGSILFRQQTRVRNFDEVHIAEVLLPVRHCQFGRFNSRVNIVGAVMTHRFKVIAFENSQGEQFCGSLTRRSILVDLITAVIN